MRLVVDICSINSSNFSALRNKHLEIRSVQFDVKIVATLRQSWVFILHLFGSRFQERQVVTEYRKMCEELIEKVGDRFISSELEQAQEERGVDESLLSQSATFGHVSGDFGRPSLARLSIASGQSIGRRSSTSAVTVPPLLVEESEI